MWIKDIGIVTIMISSLGRIAKEEGINTECWDEEIRAALSLPGSQYASSTIRR